MQTRRRSLVGAAALLAECQCAMLPDARPVSGCDTLEVSMSEVGSEGRPSCARTASHGSTVALESLEFSPLFASRNHHACSHDRSIDQHCDPRWIGRWPCGSAKYGKPSPRARWRHDEMTPRSPGARPGARKRKKQAALATQSQPQVGDHRWGLNAHHQKRQIHNQPQHARRMGVRLAHSPPALISSAAKFSAPRREKEAHGLEARVTSQNQSPTTCVKNAP